LKINIKSRFLDLASELLNRLFNRLRPSRLSLKKLVAASTWRCFVRRTKIRWQADFLHLIEIGQLSKSLKRKGQIGSDRCGSIVAQVGAVEFNRKG
jgi:hypothetical protein